MGLYTHATWSILLSAMLIGALSGCDSGARLPSKSSAEYRDAVSKFYVGLAALQVGDDVRADRRLAEFAKIAPGEPAGWANWGVLALRQRDFDAASKRLERARALATNNGHVYRLLGFLESKRGRSSEAIAKIAARANGWPTEVQEQVAALQTAAHGEDLRRAATQSTLLRNVLWRVPEFRRGYARIKAPAGEELEPFTAFLRMEPTTFK